MSDDSSPLKRSCKNVEKYIRNLDCFPQLVLGGTIKNKDRFNHHSFIFLDIEIPLSERSICCVADKFKHTWDLIVFDSSVIKFLSWDLKFIKLIKNMLSPKGLFIVPIPNCKNGTFIPSVLKPIKNVLDLDAIIPLKLWWNPKPEEYSDTLIEYYNDNPRIGYFV